MGSIAPPKTYAEWSAIIDMLLAKTDDESVYNAMSCGTLEWQSGVAERFSRRLIDAVNKRMNNAADRFQKEISRANGQERVVVGAIISLRKEMSFLSKVVDINAIPQKDRAKYKSLVIEQANNMQHSLEASAKADRTGRLAYIIRNNKVNSF